MNVIVEIGTQEDQKEISNEIKNTIGSVLRKQGAKEAINRVIVPKNFDSRVQFLSKRKSFQSSRNRAGHLVVSKIIEQKGELILIINPNIYYSKDFDYQIRCLQYLHEVFHAVNRPYFSLLYRGKENKIASNFNSKTATLKSFTQLWADEYLADRKALELSEKIEKKSHKYLNWTESYAEGMLDNLVDKNRNYLAMKHLISKFQNWEITMKDFWPSAVSIIRSTSISLVHLFGFIDGAECISNPFEDDDVKARYYDENLINYLREKYKKNEINFEDGNSITENYLRKFGIKLSDRNQQLYVNVESI